MGAARKERLHAARPTSDEPSELLERSHELSTLGDRSPLSCAVRMAGSCWSRVRPESERRRCYSGFAEDVVGRGSSGVAASLFRRPARASARHRRVNRRRLAEAVASESKPHDVAGRSSASWGSECRRCSCSKTCTGRTRRPSTCSGCFLAGSRMFPRSCWQPTATTSSTAGIPCGSS